MSGNILFVDDEPKVLSSIKRSFFKSPLNLFTANSAQEGFDILSQHEIDIVFSDVRMPEMDGLTFLKKVKEQYPDTSRIVLSGQVEESVLLKNMVLGVCFDYITKPWDYEKLSKNIDKILGMRTLLRNPNVTGLINGIDTLPMASHVLEEVDLAIENESSFDNLAEIIAKDIGITTKVIQISNSAFYGSRKISNLKEALVLLGLRHLRTVVRVSHLTEFHARSDWQRREMSELTTHILKTNFLFSFFHTKKYKRPVPIEYELCALANEIGKCILIAYFPERFQEIQKTMKHSNFGFYESELCLGFQRETHAEIGAYFLSLWNFPKITLEACLFYPYPQLCDDKNRNMYMLLELAQKYVNKIQLPQAHEEFILSEEIQMALQNLH